MGLARKKVEFRGVEGGREIFVLFGKLLYYHFP